MGRHVVGLVGGHRLGSAPVNEQPARAPGDGGVERGGERHEVCLAQGTNTQVLGPATGDVDDAALHRDAARTAVEQALARHLLAAQLGRAAAHGAQQGAVLEREHTGAGVARGRTTRGEHDALDHLAAGLELPGSGAQQRNSLHG